MATSAHSAGSGQYCSGAAASRSHQALDAALILVPYQFDSFLDDVTADWTSWSPGLRTWRRSQMFLGGVGFLTTLSVGVAFGVGFFCLIVDSQTSFTLY